MPLNADREGEFLKKLSVYIINYIGILFKESNWLASCHKFVIPYLFFSTNDMHFFLHLI